MNDQPLVSIVTPSLNQGEFIRGTIESVLSQGYPNIEYLVMDGGSTDNTLEILRSYGERLFWVSEHDSGQSQAINKGWGLARGEIITWLNADDLLCQDAVGQAVLAFETSGDDLAVVYGDCDYIDVEGHYLGNYPSREFNYEQLVLQTEDYIPQPGAFVNHKWAIQVGMLDENLQFVMDYDLWLRLGMRARFKYLNKKMSFARLHGGAKTLSSAPRFGEELASVFIRLVDNNEFPSHLVRRKEAILINAFVHAASYCFWGGDTVRARYFLYRAWRLSPLIRNRSFWRLLLFSSAGRAGWRLAEKIHGNPFRLEKGSLL
jgi:glycosyltransferase involved in cell wall biosynthesis